MKRSFNPAQVPQAIALESVEVASPCHADWEGMRGDDRSRFCPSCAKNVYNLSAMTRPEAELLLQEKEGRLCVRYFVREDGTMLTQDCPVGAAALKQTSPTFALWAGVASLFVLVGALLSPSLITGAHAQPELPRGETSAQNVTPTSTPEAPTPVPELQYPVRMGDFAAPPRPIAPPINQAAKTETSREPDVEAAPTSAPTPKPTPNKRLMGKVAIPTATPTPQVVSTRMGRVATPHPTPTPAPPAKEVPRPMMGLVAPPIKTPSQPAKKSVPSTKLPKSPNKKQR